MSSKVFALIRGRERRKREREERRK